MEEALEKFLSTHSLGTFLLDSDTAALFKDVQEKRAQLRAADAKKEEIQEDLRCRQEELESLRNILSQIQDLWESHKQQVQAEAATEVETRREISAIKQSCVQTEKQLQKVQEDSERLEYLQLTREAEARKLEEQMAGDQELLEGLLQQAAELENNNQLLLQFSAADDSTLKVQEDSERLEYLQLTREAEARKLEEQMAGDQELLEGLLQQAAELENNNQLLLQFSAADDSALKEVFLALEKSGLEVARAETSLEEARHDEAAEQSAQQALAAAFVETARRRDELLVQWELCLVTLTQKGDEHKCIVQRFLELRDKIKEAEKGEREEAAFLSRLRSSCKRIERKLAKKLKMSSDLYHQIHEAEATKLELSAQEAGLRNALKRIEEEILRVKKDINQEKEALEEKETRVKKLESRIEKTQQRLALNTELLVNTTAEARLLDASVEERERELQEVMRKKDQAGTILQQHQTELQATIQAEKAQLGEIEALKCHIKRTAIETKKASASIEKLRELCYHQRSELQTLKQKIYDLTHDANNNEEVISKQQQIKIMETDLKNLLDTVNDLKRQTSALMCQLSSSCNDLSKKQKNFDNVKEELQSVQMACENCEREKRRLINECEATDVQRALQQLQLRQRRAELQRVRAAAEDLNKSRSQMSKLIDEQCDEVKNKIKEREKEIRASEQTLHYETLSLHQSSTKLSQIQKRYTEIRVSLGAEKEEETEITAARALMKVEQDISGLQEAEDLVEEAVLEAQEDLEALNILLQEARNEGQQLRRELHSVITESVEDKPRLELEAEVQQIKKRILQGQENLKSFQRELEPDVELRVTQDSLRLVHQHLGRLTSDNLDIADAIFLYCQQASIPPPRVSSLARDKAFAASGTHTCSSRELGYDTLSASNEVVGAALPRFLRGGAAVPSPQPSSYFS
ncbi:myosin-11-like [Hyalella azteca]|uniref:Coiled-coil domain-containing protein 39 n=1 Tax=Hyalella azteca TaxID=294128 RepID=A0A979FMP9_HYAAZ|nr:myosin-11-like [Hyalella azteca]